MRHLPLTNTLRRIAAIICTIGLTCVLFGTTGATITASATATVTPLPIITTWRVYVTSAADISRLTTGKWDVLEARGNVNGMDYLLVQGDDGTATELRSLGYTVVADHTSAPAPASPLGPQTYDSGYHTIVEHYQHLNDIVTLYPGLALTVTYGASWLRTQPAATGYDLRAICITKLQPGDCVLQPGGSKPRFFMMAAIHARELTTAEMAWRWIDMLVNGYGVDPDITALLNTSEMWVVPLANPDGRAVVEQGGNAPNLQRKNVDDSAGPCNALNFPSEQVGIDLNRNASFQWGVAGASTFACDLIYHGPVPASEPEEQALEALMTDLFGRQRLGSDINGTLAVPITATGAMLTLHSYSDLVLLPWGYTTNHAPNDNALRSMAFHMSYFNHYVTGQPTEALYAASGTSDDWAYGVLGIPGFTFEIGPTADPCAYFTPLYSCQDGRFWPLNWPAFLYAAKLVHQPYTMGPGPTVATSVTTVVALAGSSAIITAVVSSDLLGPNASGSARPITPTVSAAEYTIDAPSWVSGTVPVSMGALSGSFGSNSVTVSAPIDTSALCAARHLVYIHGRTTDGNWGPTTAVWLDIQQPIGIYYCATATPIKQFQYGYPSTTRTFKIDLTNFGNISDTFAVNVANNSWPTIPASNMVGPIPPSTTASMMVTVSIPPGTSGQTDSASVTFSSLGSPTHMMTGTFSTGSWYKLLLPEVLR